MATVKAAQHNAAIAAVLRPDNLFMVVLLECFKSLPGPAGIMNWRYPCVAFPKMRASVERLLRKSHKSPGRLLSFLDRGPDGGSQFGGAERFLQERCRAHRGLERRRIG